MTSLSFTLHILLLYKGLQRRGVIIEVFLQVESFEEDLEGEWEVQLAEWWKGSTRGLRVRHLQRLSMARHGSGVDGTGGLRGL